MKIFFTLQILTGVLPAIQTRISRGEQGAQASFLYGGSDGDSDGNGDGDGDDNNGDDNNGDDSNGDNSNGGHDGDNYDHE
jgi:hypothetical protein